MVSFRSPLMATATVQLLLLLCCYCSVSSAFSLSPLSVSDLLTQKASEIASLKEVAAQAGVDITQTPYSNDVFFLRYCIEADDNDATDIQNRLKQNLQWRLNEGKAICDAAQTAIQEATSGTNKWNNDPVLQAAPSSQIITKYLTPSTTLTTTNNQGDLVYCIRAGMIDDTNLMSALGGDSTQKLIQFFLYCKEVNAAVANQYSLTSDRLVSVLTANDLSGVKLVGGDPTFRQALSAASKEAAPLYPALSGPTLLLNLPRLLGALVKLFTPLFPPEVKKRLRFERGPLEDVKDLMEISHGGSGRDEFLKQIDDLVYGDDE